MNHKHRKPRRSRAGCKMCKPWKIGTNTDQLPAREAARKRNALKEITQL